MTVVITATPYGIFAITVVIPKHRLHNAPTGLHIDPMIGPLHAPTALQIDPILRPLHAITGLQIEPVLGPL